MTPEQAVRHLQKYYGIKSPCASEINALRAAPPMSYVKGEIKSSFKPDETEDQKWERMRHKEEDREKRERISRIMSYVNGCPKHIWKPDKSLQVVRERAFHIRKIKDTMGVKCFEIALAINNVFGTKMIDKSSVEHIYKHSGKK